MGKGEGDYFNIQFGLVGQGPYSRQEMQVGSTCCSVHSGAVCDSAVACHCPVGDPLQRHRAHVGFDMGPEEVFAKATSAGTGMTLADGYCAREKLTGLSRQCWLLWGGRRIIVWMTRLAGYERLGSRLVD